MIALFIQRHISHYSSPYIDPRFNDVDNHGISASVRNLYCIYIQLQILTIFGGLMFTYDSS